MNESTTESLTTRMRSDREELAQRISRVLPGDGLAEPQPGLFFQRVSSPIEPVHGVLEPSFCVIAQGSKDILLGDERFHYDPAHYLISTVGLPAVGQVAEASPELPYLSFRLSLDPSIVTAAMIESGFVQPSGEANAKAVNVTALDSQLLDATLRLVRLLDAPEDYPALAPLVVREIVYRLLRGEQGGRLRHLAKFGGQAHRMVRALNKFRTEFDKPLRADDVAKEIGMSSSAFHSHFRAVTAMSPLQFQKQLRLQEARRLMLSEDFDAAQAGFRVGYEDASQFSREYKRHFGKPPIRDVEQPRELATNSSR